MNPAEWIKIKEVFNAVIDLPENERAILLKRCDKNTLNKVEDLLHAHDNAHNFIEASAIVEVGLFNEIEPDVCIGKQIADYKILKEIGHGGMGTVYLAAKSDESFDKKVAIKLIKRGMDTTAVLKRFLMERKILASLENPNIANLIDGGSTSDGLPYLVMEYIEGEPITKFCDFHRFSIAERLELFRKVCSAVSYAHQNLVVHRDIKPANILVTKDGTPKLLDFGIAKLLNPDWSLETGESTATMFRLMTPEYASPEQIRGLRITTASDVYSLGIVLYELLSGERPYKIESQMPQEVANVVLTKNPRKPSDSVTRRRLEMPTNQQFQSPNPKSLKGDLDNIVLKAIRKDREKRYQSVQEFSEDIRRFLVGLPVIATSDSTFYRFSKVISRNKIGTAIAGVILILSGVSVWQSIEARQERTRANERFNQVRILANAVLFDYQDNIRNLPGSTLVRERMVSDGANYLNNLATEKSSSPELQMELARAYDRLGDVKGNFSTASVGNAMIAREFYTKAFVIKEKMLREDANNLDYLEHVAVSYDKLGDVEFGLGNQDITIEYYKKAVSLREQILQSNTTDRGIGFRLMKGYRNIAVRGRNIDNIEESMALCEKALEMSERLVHESPENLEYLEGFGDVFEGIAAILETNLKRRPEAIEAYRKLIEIRGQHVAKYPNNSVLRQKFGMSYNYLGNTFFELKKLPQGIEQYRKSLAILDPLGQQDPLNEPLIQDTANIRSSLAYSLAVIGGTTESFESFNSIIRIFEEKYAKDETDKTTHFRIAMAKEGLAITYSNIANLKYQTKTERIDALKKAIRFFGESSEIYQIHQNRNGAFPSINVDVGEAIAEVAEATKRCAEKLDKLLDKN